MKNRLKKVNKKGREKKFYLSLPQLVIFLSFFQPCSPLHAITAIFKQVMEKSLRRIELTLNRNLRHMGLMVF